MGNIKKMQFELVDIKIKIILPTLNFIIQVSRKDNYIKI